MSELTFNWLDLDTKDFSYFSIDFCSNYYLQFKLFNYGLTTSSNRKIKIEITCLDFSPFCRCMAHGRKETAEQETFIPLVLSFSFFYLSSSCISWKAKEEILILLLLFYFLVLSSDLWFTFSSFFLLSFARSAQR